MAQATAPLLDSTFGIPQQKRMLTHWDAGDGSHSQHHERTDKLFPVLVQPLAGQTVSFSYLGRCQVLREKIVTLL